MESKKILQKINLLLVLTIRNLLRFIFVCSDVFFLEYLAFSPELFQILTLMSIFFDPANRPRRCVGLKNSKLVSSLPLKEALEASSKT